MTQKMKLFSCDGLLGPRTYMMAGSSGQLAALRSAAQSTAPARPRRRPQLRCPPDHCESARGRALQARYQPNRFAGRAARFYALSGNRVPSVKAGRREH